MLNHTGEENLTCEVEISGIYCKIIECQSYKYIF